MSAQGPKVVIVGAGFGGIAAAIELRRHGIRDVTILERAPELGGTWHFNSYPGAACDVPSHLYSFSFAQRRDWTRLCSPQQDILRYLHGVAREHGLEELIVTGTTVTATTWDDETLRWTITTQDGPVYEADAVILATGQLHQPAYPRIEGADSFEGHVFHSAQWDHDRGSARSEGRGHRDRRQRRAVRPRDRQGGRAPDRLPALGKLVHAAQEPALPGSGPRRDPAHPRPAGVPPAVHLPLRRAADRGHPPPEDRRRASCTGARAPSCERS